MSVRDVRGALAVISVILEKAFPIPGHDPIGEMEIQALLAVDDESLP